MSIEINTQVVVVGSGPGGYSAAFRCADLGLETVLIERYHTLGGVCLNVGCIPSKALLHIAKLINDFKLINRNNIFSEQELKININNLRTWKTKLISNLTTSLGMMTKIRNIKLVNGYAKFIDSHTIEVINKDNCTIVHFENAIIAAGSRPSKLSFIPYDDTRIWNSTDALTLNTIPNRLLIMGGGAIGLEMATIYHTLGSSIDIVEMSTQVMPSIDKDIAQFFTKQINNNFNLMLESQVTAIEIKENTVFVTIKGVTISTVKQYDAVLVAIGRVPNSDILNISSTKIEVDNSGFILVNKHMCTNISHIYAIGDIVSTPMLAHKAMHEGHIAAEVIAGNKHYFEPKVIPSVAYTEPEVAWVGLTAREAQEQNINYEIASFPWTALGRASASDCQNGLTRLIFDKKSHRLIGGGIIGNNGGELLGEICLAIEMGCDAEDIALTIHAHPTLYESIGLAAQVYQGTITDLPNIKK